MVLEILVIGFGYFFLAFSLGTWVGYRAGLRERPRASTPPSSELPTYRQ